MSWTPVLLWAALIWILSSIPGDEFPEIGWDSGILSMLAYFILYFILAGLCFRAIKRTYRQISFCLTAFVVLFAAAGYGILNEWHQAFVPGRHPSVNDALINTAGILCFLGMAGISGRCRTGQVPKKAMKETK